MPSDSSPADQPDVTIPETEGLLRYPLRAWTRPLTRAESHADWESDRPEPVFSANPTDDPDAHELQGWWPVLPSSIPRCPVCKLPVRSSRVCRRCRRLLSRYGQPLETLELLTVVDKRNPPETLIWAWKEDTINVSGVWQHPANLIAPIAARLAPYIEAQAQRLLADDPVLTAVPSRAPLIEAAFHVAAENGAPPRTLARSGSKFGHWYQHGSTTAERLSRTLGDWQIVEKTVAGRTVVLFDDVFVTGASMFSYALALISAGAAAVRGVAIGHHVAHNYRDYRDALRIVRRQSPYYWSARRASVFYPGSM